MGEKITVDDGKIVKMEVDYSTETEQKIPQAEALAKAGKLKEGLDLLLSLEKLARTNGDTHSTGRILVAIVKICFESKDFNALNENLVLLSKRRSQMKQAIQKMVQQCVDYVDHMPDEESKLKLIDTLRTITAGKIYVEVERARLTHKLAQMKETKGNTKEACDIMQELQVETFGSMEKREKVELILEQIRLCLLRHDYVRTQIIARKISTKFFDDVAQQDLKLRYYGYMIELGQHDGSYLNICKHYLAIYNSPSIQENPDKRQEALKNAVLYLVLSPYNNEQHDLMHRLKLDKNLDELPKYKDLLVLFTTLELIHWRALCTNYEADLRGVAPTMVFNKAQAGETRWKDLKNRVVEHNIRIMAKYYTRIALKRMDQLLDLTAKETEEVLSRMVVNKIIYAKVDRLVGIVHFTPQHKDPEEVLNEWSHKLNQLTALVSKTTHLINKEEMVHRHMMVTEG